MTASPSPSPDESLSPLVESLASGFESLLSTLRAHHETEKALRARLEFAANEYEKILVVDSTLSASSIAPSQIVKQIRLLPACKLDDELSDPVRKAEQAIRRYRMSKSQKPHMNGARCPVPHGNSDPEDLERDFTVPGVQGTLGCPFAKLANGSKSIPQEDPIAAEIHQDKASTRSPNPDQRPGQCPIRFLDQHSPEEIAQYVENHKHEIPRSHEICVRRYQGNESGARQVDAKYGSLANMIQGLGVKHKAYLPERDRADEPDKASSHVVERWADNLSQDPTPAVDETGPSDEEPRLSRFEKPLREVRVGESPSRPWGISVPADKEPTPSALQSEAGVGQQGGKSESSPAVPDQKRAGCPIDHGQRKHQHPKPTPEEVVEPKDQARNQTQIVFNGPVFFGYSADQVAALLQNTSLGNMKPGSG